MESMTCGTVEVGFCSRTAQMWLAAIALAKLLLAGSPHLFERAVGSCAVACEGSCAVQPFVMVR